MRHQILISLLVFLFTLPSFATDRRGHLGVGFNNQLKNDLTSLSIKFQGSRTFAFETLAGFKSGADGGYGLGIKVYRILFDEPQLNFYLGTLVALEQKKSAGVSKSGFQFDLTFGSEFHFAGLHSLALSIDFGASIYKFDELTIETTASGFVSAAIRFYL